MRKRISRGRWLRAKRMNMIISRRFACVQLRGLSFAFAVKFYVIKWHQMATYVPYSWRPFGDHNTTLDTPWGECNSKPDSQIFFFLITVFVVAAIMRFGRRRVQFRLARSTTRVHVQQKHHYAVINIFCALDFCFFFLSLCVCVCAFFFRLFPFYSTS